MSEQKIITVKEARNGVFPSPLIYKHNPLVIIGPEKNVLWAGSREEFLKDQLIATGYYDTCELKAREHNLHLNDNTKIAAMTATPSTQHTPEPWRLFGSACIEDARGATIARCRQGDAFDPITASEMLANARRIVECVNACKGFDSETLRDLCSGGVPTLHEYFIRQRESASRIQSLEAALREWYAFIEKYGHPELKKMAREALGHQEASCE